jgi:hypothetical protein
VSKVRCNRSRKAFVRGCALAAALMVIGTARATPIGDSFMVETLNFPTTVGPVGTMTFNDAGDTTTEAQPGSGGALLVSEQFAAGAGPSGGDLLSFRFELAEFPDDPSGSFAFRISDLDWADGAARKLLVAALSIDFGVSVLPQTNVTSLTTASGDDGLDLLFQVPVSWASVFGLSSPPAGALPTQIVADFQVEVTRVPVAPTLGLLFAGAVAMRLSRRGGQA